MNEKKLSNLTARLLPKYVSFFDSYLIKVIGSDTGKSDSAVGMISRSPDSAVGMKSRSPDSVVRTIPRSLTVGYSFKNTNMTVLIVIGANLAHL